MPEGNLTDDEDTLPSPERNETVLVPQEGHIPPSDDEIPSRVRAKNPLPKENERGDTPHKRHKSHKRCKPPSSDDEMPSGVGTKKSSSKGKPTQKKKSPWQKTENV
uniref:Uncharacterized protein n=1 Tax=Knipowitschia caucasica TaxID=637954 RepID=A0AAV2L4N9_KNICA